ncbi:MAG TPA: DUF6544 family protein [bacterium]
MTRDLTIDELWDAARPAGRAFQPGQVAGLPEAARRYLVHAIAAGAPLAAAVRLRMHGEIRLKEWLPFTAEQVIHRERGMIWQATVRRGGIAIRGYDRLLDGAGVMRWRLFGMFPVVAASGPDVTRSAAGRVAAESVWLPSLLCDGAVAWETRGPSEVRARLPVHGVATEVDLTVDEHGKIATVHLQRWGNPDGRDFRWADFGGVVEEEGSFGPYTIPTRLRVGWHFHEGRFGPDGEFFRVTVDAAMFR